MEPNNIEPKQSLAESDKLLIPGAIIVAGLLIAGAVIYSGGFIGGKTPGRGSTAAIGDIPPTSQNIEDDDPSLGSPEAPVVLVEFSDFQCPFCRRLWRDALPQIKEKYIKTGKVRFVYRDYPLSQIHPGAEPAALAAECAEDQGKFWEMHDKIFEEQDKLGQGTVEFGVSDLKRWAGEIGLNASLFGACLDGEKYKAEVAKDLSDGASLGVSGTPHVFVNGKLLIRGALPFEQIDQLIQQELSGR